MGGISGAGEYVPPALEYPDELLAEYEEDEWCPWLVCDRIGLGVAAYRAGIAGTGGVPFGAGVYVRKPCPGVAGRCAAALALALEDLPEGEDIEALVEGRVGDDMDAEVEGRVGEESPGVCEREDDSEGAEGVEGREALEEALDVTLEEAEREWNRLMGLSGVA